MRVHLQSAGLQGVCDAGRPQSGTAQVSKQEDIRCYIQIFHRVVRALSTHTRPFCVAEN